MFTLKKVALIGAAGLAAFSMSCSDSDGSDPGGSFTTTPSITDGDIGGQTVWNLEGVITATNESGSSANTISNVSITANGDTVGTVNSVTVGETTANLSGSMVFPIAQCAGKLGSEITVKVAITATFISGDKLSEEISKKFACPSDIAIPTIAIDTVNVGGTSATLGSYVDVDAKRAYLTADLETKKADIDLIYGAKSSTTYGDKIYSTSGIALADPQQDQDAVFVELLDLEDYTPSAIIPLTAVPDYATAISSLFSGSATEDQLEELYNLLTDEAAIAAAIAGAVPSVDATAGTTFIVFTTNGNFVPVKVLNKNTTVSIDLGLIGDAILD